MSLPLAAALLAFLPAVAQSAEVVLTSRGEAAVQEHAFDDQAASFSQIVNGSTPTGWIKIGTPPKWLLVIFDTGSDILVAKTWDTVQTELDKLDQGVRGMVQPTDHLYNHASSSTYRVKMMKNEHGKNVRAQSEISYGSGSAITDEGNDTVAVGHFALDNFSISEITADSLSLLHTDANISGILGLQHMKNRSAGMSIFNRLRDADQLHSFGYCRGTGDNGTFIWGDHSTEGHEIPVIGSIHWAVKLSTMKITATANASGNATHHDNHTSIITRMQDQGENHSVSNVAIMDTGSNIIAGPTPIMEALSNKANVKADCSNFDSLPDIHFSLGGHAVTVTPKGYVMKIAMPDIGMGGYGDGDGDSADGFGDGDGDGSEDGAGESGGDGDGMGLDQQAVKHQRHRAHQKAKLGWKAAIAHLKKHKGIDLAPAMANVELDDPTLNATLPEFMCMPAFVPLDKETSFGPLYIVGTPLLQTTYARWSWAKDDESPKIFLKNLTESSTCHSARADSWADTSVSLEADGSVSSSPLLRSEPRPIIQDTARNQEQSFKGPFIRTIDEIFYPHWATRLENGGQL